MGYELYCAAHLIQAGVATARATGDCSLLAVARRFADLIDDVFGNDPARGTDGHPEIEVALAELYRQTGETRYLRLANTLTRRRGFGTFAGGRFDLDYYQDAEPVRDARGIVGHAMRALYLAAGVTDIYAETGDEALLASMLRQWDDLASAKSYLTGGVGSRHYGEAIGDAYELPPDRAYCETCASIASMMWNWRMLLVTGESRFADLFERTLYNGFLSGLSLDGESFFYANPLQSRTGEHRHRWNRVACCPPNIMRLLASLHHYLATVTDDGIQLHQYASSRIRAGDVVLSVETAYPWDGTARVEVVESPDREWTLALRIPGWAREATLDGEAVAAGGYAEVRRRWRDGTQVVLLLDVSPRLTVPNLTQQFIQGHAAMMVNGPWIFPELNQKGWKYNDQYGIVPISTNHAGQTVIAPLGGETIDLGTGGSTEQQKLAWEWLQGMQQASTMEHVTSLMYYLPTKPAVTEQVLKGGPEYTVFAKETQTARSRTTEYGANYPKVSQAIWTAIQAAITGTSSVSSALQTAQGTISGVQQVSGG